MKLKTQFDFDAAHRLVGHKGKCNNLHGHMWKVEIEIEGPYYKVDDLGILWDFGNTKKIEELFDHKTILKDCPKNHVLIQMIKEVCGEDSIYVMKQNPTAEHLCKEILTILKSQNNNLNYAVKIWESPKSYAELDYVS